MKFIHAFLASLLALVAGAASAYPDKPVQYIIPFPPGGESDITARMQAIGELGFNWVDGAYRGIAVPTPTPREVQKQVSDMMLEVNADPEMRKKLSDGGYDVIDVTLDKMPAFLAEKAKAYIDDAKAAGLIK